MMRRLLQGHSVHLSSALQGASPVLSGEQDKGLPNVTRTAETPPCVTLFLATGGASFSFFLMTAGRWEQLAAREHE